MTFTKSPAVAAPARPARKSPLRAATLGGMAPVGPGLTGAEILAAGTGLRREAVPAPDLRRMEISEFTAWLRSRTNKHHREVPPGPSRPTPSPPTPTRPAPCTSG